MAPQLPGIPSAGFGARRYDRRADHRDEEEPSPGRSRDLGGPGASAGSERNTHHHHRGGLEGKNQPGARLRRQAGRVPGNRRERVLDHRPLLVDVHTPKANVQYTTLDRKPLKSVRNRHQTNTILNTSHEPKSTTVLELKYRSYEMFTIIQEFTEKYRGFRGSLFSIHPLSGCERLLPIRSL